MPTRATPSVDHLPLPALESLKNDLRCAARTLRRSPSFTFVAVLTLALGIGGVTAAFSLVHGVLLRPLPFPSDHELVVLRQHVKEGADDLRNRSRCYSVVAAMKFAVDAAILGGTEPARGAVVSVSREFFSALGVRPFLGRPLLPEENRPGAAAVAVVGHEFWVRVLGAQKQLDTLRLTIGGVAYLVVGVLRAPEPGIIACWNAGRGWVVITLHSPP